MKIVAATTNQGKVREFQEILGELGFEIVSIHEMGIDVEVEETGSSFTENALIKARAVSLLCDDMPVMADDSGLCIDALDDAPGLYSARFAGEEATDEDRNKKILELMKNAENRHAYYIASVAFIFPDGREITAEGKVEGEIMTTEEGTGGFGYDPIFYCTEIEKSFGIAAPEEKNAVSHRGRALKNLCEILKKEMEE
ncbi:MAG: RdgB/HAM1 family non-canonical purine NTP pyrophosphatase [Firmicutes bacterium]|nr:RdgB/HAM1 family non-canonical purine NTP pyrophosphatase [Bacillota bacterium]